MITKRIPLHDAELRQFYMDGTNFIMKSLPRPTDIIHSLIKLIKYEMNQSTILQYRIGKYNSKTQNIYNKYKNITRCIIKQNILSQRRITTQNRIK